MADYTGSDGTEYFNKPTSGRVQTIGKSSKTEVWLDDDGETVWETVKIGKRIWWRRKVSK